MKKTLGFLAGLMLVLSVVPAAFATPGAGGSTVIDVGTESFIPLIWMDPDSRIFYRSPADGGLEMIERIANYAFEGEQIEWLVLVMDKNGVEDIADVRVTVGLVQGTGNPIEAACALDFTWGDGDDITDFHATLDEELLTSFDEDTMEVYLCTLTIETFASMWGEYWVAAEVEDDEGNMNTFDENEYWFFNPIIALSITGTIDFGTVRPGTHGYSETILVENNAEAGSGVLLDMTISGEDFYDPASVGAMCPLSNRIVLNSGGLSPTYPQDGAVDPADDFVRSTQTDCDNGFVDEAICADCSPTVPDAGDDLGTEDEFDVFCYYATNGAYSTANDNIRRDIEGYLGIPYETGSEDDRAPIISSDDSADYVDFGGGTKSYFAGNVLPPGDEIAITFRLTLPEPCNGDFSEGDIFFWGTAI